MKILPNIPGKTILITGIHGFLGVHTSIMALKTGANVVGVDLPGSSTRGKKVRFSLGGEQIPFKEADLSNYEDWPDILKETKPDIILHLAGATKRGLSGADWFGNIHGNFLTTSAMIQAVISLPEQERPVVVYPGSQMEYGTSSVPWTEETLCRPINPYGASKLASTNIILTAERAKMIRVCVARFSILYGPAQPPTMFIPELISKVLAGVNFKMTEGRQKRRFLYVSDAASLILNLGARLLKQETLPALINMPASEPRSIREVAQQIVDCIDKPVAIEIGAISLRDNETIESWPDDSLAKSLGLACKTTLEDGLKQTVQWYKDNPWFLKGSAL